MQPLISNTFSVSAVKDGKDAYVLDLTNQMNSVPVDANGKVTYDTTLTTVARIIKGADYVREEIGLPSASSLKIGDVTPSVNNSGGLVTIEWKFTMAHTLTSERYVKTIQIIHGGKPYSADYVVRTDKSGATYDLLPSMTEIPFVRDASYNLIPGSQKLYCGYTKNQDGKITSFAGKAAAELHNIDSKYNIFYRYVKSDGTFTSWSWMKDVSGFGLEISRDTDYSAVEFSMSSSGANSSVSDTNIIDRETVPIVKQSERGFGIVTSVQRDNFTEAQWSTYGTIGHEETWSDTSSIRNNARIGDLFTVVGKATDTGNGHTATYRCTNSSGNLKGICIAHQIARAAERRATFFMYKRLATSTTDHGISGTLTYTFSTGKLSGTSSYFNGWTQDIPANNGNPLYVIAATAYSQTDTDTIDKNEWSAPVLYNKDGLHTASVFLYKRAASSPSSAMPTGKLTYTFKTGLLSGSYFNGWSQTIPSTDGNPCWVIQATAVNSSDTDDIENSEWSTPQKYAIDGESAFIGDLSNEADLFGTDASGKVIDSQNRTTKAYLFYGTKKQILTANPSVSLTYAASGNAVPASVAAATALTGKDTDEAMVTITIKANQYVTDTIYADITLNCAIGSQVCRFTLKSVKSGSNGISPELWQLALDKDNLSFSRNDDDSLSPDSITLHAYAEKTVEATTTRHTSSVSGMTISWGYDEESAQATGKEIGTAVTVSKSTAASKRFVWIELYKSGVSGWIDRETVPIVKDGKKGDAGADGNGISSVTMYRMFTMTFAAPSIYDSGWISENNSSYPAPSGLTKEKRYLWQKKETTYEKTSTTYEISLVAQLDSGICANLLECTAFNSLAEMEAWNKKSEYYVKNGQNAPAESGKGVVTKGIDGQNAYYDGTSYGSSVINYKDVLQQTVWQNASDGVKKLEYNEWYTFSFWVRGDASASLRTYIYPSCINNSSDIYVDNVKQDSVGDDGCIAWGVTNSWVRHSVTFRTKGNFYNSVVGGYTDQEVLFRLLPTGTTVNNVYICMPKLEKNTMATEWIENTNDRMAEDIQHVYTGEWASGSTYYYGGGTGVRHVVMARTSAFGTKSYFRLKKRTTSAGYHSTVEPYIDTENWEKASYLKFVASDFILADEAIIRFASTNRILVTNPDNGMVAAGMGGAIGGNTDFPIWVGATYENRGNAPYRVTLTGKLYAREADIVGKIEGSIRNPFMLVNDSFSTYEKDNMIMMTSGDGWASAFSLKWDVEQSGRVIRLLSYKWDNSTSPAEGWGGILAPAGKYFYEGGKQYSKLQFSREIIELLGYGTPSTFFGWIVMKRIDLMTDSTYGIEQKCLCLGRINGNRSSGVAFSNYKTCDNSTLSISKTSTGLYKIEIPTSWKLKEKDLLVSATPVGYIYGGTNMLFCSVESIVANASGYVQYVSLQCSDDQSRNDGDIFFSMYNINDWSYLDS